MKRPTLRDQLAAAVDAPHVDVRAIADALQVSETAVRRAIRDRAERRLRTLYAVTAF